MEIGPDGHRYNDDLLIHDQSLTRAEVEHPLVFPVLNHPELRDKFLVIDQEAGRRKRLARAVGFWAVVLALGSLLIGASEALWGHTAEGHKQKPLAWWIGLMGAVLGILAVVASSWVLHGQRKVEWLRTRLRTERFRQFHFQTFLFYLPDILAVVAARRSSNPTGEVQYCDFRHRWFDAYLQTDARWAADAHPHAVIEDVVRWDRQLSPPVWLHEPTAGGVADPVFPSAAAPADDLNAVFRAYDALRFTEQIGYADYNLRETNRPIPAGPSARRPWRSFESFPGKSLPPVQWRKILRWAWRVAFGLLVVLHIALLMVMLFFPSVDAQSLGLHVGVLCAALMAVAARTLSDGFALTREIERFEEYRAVCSDLQRRFQAATAPEEKFRLMVQMERAAYEEMREFMRSHLEATFVL